LLHSLEIVTVNEGASTGQYHTLLAVARFAEKRKKIKSGYFIVIPCIVDLILALKGIYLLVTTHVIFHIACQTAQLSVTIPCSSFVSVRSDYWHFICANARTVLLHVFVVLSIKIIILWKLS
jgi:hypothetical protein